MEMPILELTVSNLPDPIIADMEYDIICQVIGSQPPPKITWTLGEIQLPAGKILLQSQKEGTICENEPKIKL